MDLQNEKCVMVIDPELPLGLIANTAAIMGITLGQKMPEVVGTDVADRSGHTHPGIIAFPVPVLKAAPEDIKALREKLYQPEFQDVTAVDFSDRPKAAKPTTIHPQDEGNTGKSAALLRHLPSAAPKEDRYAHRQHAAAAMTTAIKPREGEGTAAAVPSPVFKSFT